MVKQGKCRNHILGMESRKFLSCRTGEIGATHSLVMTDGRPQIHSVYTGRESEMEAKYGGIERQFWGCESWQRERERVKRES